MLRIATILLVRMANGAAAPIRGVNKLTSIVRNDTIDNDPSRDVRVRARAIEIVPSPSHVAY